MECIEGNIKAEKGCKGVDKKMTIMAINGIFILQCSLQLYLYFTNRKTHVSLLLGIVFEKEYFDLDYSRFLFAFEYEP